MKLTYNSLCGYKQSQLIREPRTLPSIKVVHGRNGGGHLHALFSHTIHLNAKSYFIQAVIFSFSYLLTEFQVRLINT